MEVIKQIIKSASLLTTKDIKELLNIEGKKGNINLSGHYLPQQGEEYIELRNVVFVCDKDYIINAPEYENLKNGTWYENNYEPLVKWQLPKAIEKMIKNPDTRQAVLSFYDPDMMLDRDNMICTMYVSLRLDKNAEGTHFLSYTVHMRSSDIREFRSDLKWHKKVQLYISKDIQKEIKSEVWCKPIVWYADSLQCWDKDWEFLKT